MGHAHDALVTSRVPPPATGIDNTLNSEPNETNEILQGRNSYPHPVFNANDWLLLGEERAIEMVLIKPQSAAEATGH